jgi:hypothetical protein
MLDINIASWIRVENIKKVILYVKKPLNLWMQEECQNSVSQNAISEVMKSV